MFEVSGYVPHLGPYTQIQSSWYALTLFNEPFYRCNGTDETLKNISLSTAQNNGAIKFTKSQTVWVAKGVQKLSFHALIKDTTALSFLQL